MHANILIICIQVHTFGENHFEQVGSCSGRCWHTYLMAIWSILLPFGMYILWPLGKFYGYLVYFSVLECFTKKNLATLILSPFHDQIAP
jgi:hypothetical protein